MKYQVSDKVQGSFNTLVADANVQKALKFMEDDQNVVVEKQVELTLIPAPTGHEEKKAQRMLEMFKEEGLTDCHIDEYGNCVGIRKGTGGGKTTLIEGHMDTVFALDTKLEDIREDGYIKIPGISDDTRGCAVVLSTIRALNAANIQTKGDIHFVGTVQEEGTGALRGMKYYVTHHPELQASISVDGPGYQGVTYEATGIQTYEVRFNGIGGHACGMFGKVANPLHAAARAITKISEFRVPSDPMTTFAVTNFHAGSFEAVHAIVPQATIRFNFRSNSQEELEKLRKRIFDAIEEACKEETDRWGQDTITYEVEHICDVNAGHQDSHAPIVEASMAAAHYLGCEEPELGDGGSTNCNRALEVGLPAVCLGIGCDYDTFCHTLNERFKIEGAYKGCQQTLLLALLCAGCDAVDSII
ncbi:M20/M25/M40 family metallo-hydrolase [bacterium 1XD42-94]|nr:M20/M25/M40 family metallo-hydrolase [bacterium 1XD42-76]NBK03853.1 M20/M25/M40 family metallo-hydrolase [bacterium 1XD42-94]